jgi:hypothetical protein
VCATVEPIAKPKVVVATGSSALAAVVQPQVKLGLLQAAALWVLAWAQLSSERPSWPEGPCRKYDFSFHVASRCEAARPLQM